MHAHRRARRGVARVANARCAEQVTHVPRTENIEHHAFGFVHVKHRAVGGHDARSVLPTMLQAEQPVIEQLIHGAVRDDANHTTHGAVLLDDSVLSSVAAVPTPAGAINLMRFAKSSGKRFRRMLAMVANGFAVALSRHQLI